MSGSVTSLAGTRPVKMSGSVTSLAGTRPVKMSGSVTSLAGTRPVKMSGSVTSLAGTRPVKMSGSVTSLAGTRPVKMSGSVTSLAGTRPVKMSGSVTSLAGTRPVKMSGSVTSLAAFLLLLTLVAAAVSQQTSTCTSESGHVICRSGTWSRVEVLNESGTWREAHELCRRRGRFLVPSDQARQSLPDTVSEMPAGWLERLNVGFWAGASILRNGYYQWQLPTEGVSQLSEEMTAALSGAEPSSVCGILTAADGQWELNWTACADQRPIVCFSDDVSESLTKPASYRPSLTVQVGEKTLVPGTDGDTVLVDNSYELELPELQFRLVCGDGDSVVKDHFVIGRAEFRSDRWPGNVTILRRLHPPAGGNDVTVGTFWCQRYVHGAVDPVTSGRLHVTTSEDMYVLTAPRGEIVAMIESIWTNHNYYEEGSELSPPDRSRSLEVQLRGVLNDTRSSEFINLRYMALYDSFNTISSAYSLRENAEPSPLISLEPQNETIRLLFDADIRTGHWLSNYHVMYRNQTLQQKLRKVFQCADERTGDHLWRQRELDKLRSRERNGFVYRPASEYEFAEPACVASNGLGLVGRRCMPQFDRGAHWGAFCAAGVCSDGLPRCNPPPPHCQAGFQLLLLDGDTVFDEQEEGPRERACALLVRDVAFEDRAEACWRHEPTATPWSVPQSAPLNRALLSVIDRPMWLPFRRMWAGGPLWPTAANLVTEGLFYENDEAVRLEADLRTDLNCTVVTPDLRLRSVACDERHAVVCVAPPIASGGDDITLNSPSWFPQHAPCSSAGPSSVLIPGLRRCSALICHVDDSPVPWSEAASLCAESSSSLASLTSQRHLDIVARLARTAGGDRPLAAVNLTRRDGRVVWGDGSELTYPALSPNLSIAEQHDHGVLDFSRNQYDFVGNDDSVATCAVCEHSVASTAPEIAIFYGSSLPGATIFANITNVHSSLTSPEQSPAGVLSCFASTSQGIEMRYRVTILDVTLREIQRQSSDDPTTSRDPTTRFGRVLPRVDFGYLLCGAKTPVGIVMSNSLVLRSGRYRGEVEEYVVGLQVGQWQGSECDPTFCLNQCPCFNQSIEGGMFRRTEDGSPYRIALHSIRVTRSDDGYGAGEKRIEHYFATLDFTVPARRRRQAVELTTESSEDARQVPGERPRARGMLLLRNELGSQLAYIRPARCCPAERTEEPVPLSWPETCGGVTASVELCVDGSGQPALRRCLGGPLTGVQWEPVAFGGTSCAAASAVTTNLHQLSQVTVTTANLVSTAADLERLTAEPAALVPQDLVSVAVTLENMQAALEDFRPPLAQDIATLQESTVTVVSHVMELDTATIAGVTESLQVGPRIVRALERVLVSPSVVNTTSVTAGNVAVRFGNFAGISSSSQDITNASLQTVARGAGLSGLLGVESALLLLDGLPAVNAVFLVYRDGRLLHSSGQRVTSQVVSVLLPNTPDATQLQSNVLMTFRHRPAVHRYPPVCAYWDFNALQWSTRGCWLEAVRNDSDVCRCNHLTNFARIFNYETDVYLSKGFHRLLDVITYVGCALSLFGLLLTMITFVLFKNWRKFRGNQIVMHLSVALTGVYLTFLFGLAATENHFACMSLSALLHYFLLAAFGWMAVEAVFQYLRFVKVVGTYISRFMQKASLLAWGGSLVPVICVLAVGPHRYDGQPDVCWMDFESFVYALVLPLVAVMVFNAVTFGLIVYSLSCGRQKGLRTNQPERQLALRRLRVSIITFILLGLPWVFGFLSIREARLVFTILFCVCCMLQGFTIFLLMVAGESSVRGLWHGLVAGTCCHSGTGTGSGSGTGTGTDNGTDNGTKTPATHSVTDSAPPTRPPAAKSDEITRL